MINHEHYNDQQTPLDSKSSPYYYTRRLSSLWELLGTFFWLRRSRRSCSPIDHTEPLLQENHSNTESCVFLDDNDFVFVENDGPRSGSTPAPTPSPWTSLLRIIKLAKTQRSYIYIGCFVLIVRLPFSLSIPNFVSASLAALARQDYDGAQQSIILILLYGSIDSVLNFCCGTLFALANLNIVKTLRDDTFEAILGQDIVFFRDNDCGDLASRLSSDCSAIVGDLSGFFRDSIESVIRITWIMIYMSFRSPILAACALASVPIIAIMNNYYADWLRRNTIDVQNAVAEANKMSLEAFSKVKTDLSLSSLNNERSKYFQANQNLYKTSLYQLYAGNLYNMTINVFLINTCVQSLLLWIGMMLIKDNRFSSDVVLDFMFYQGQLQTQVLILLGLFTSLMRSSGAGEKVFSIFDRSESAV